MHVDSCGWIKGYMTGGATGWNPVLGKVVGDRAYIAIDVYPDGTPGSYEAAFFVGTVPARAAQIVLTLDGMSHVGPLDIEIVPITGPRARIRLNNWDQSISSPCAQGNR